MSESSLKPPKASATNKTNRRVGIAHHHKKSPSPEREGLLSILNSR
ncbi:MAG: hypothetical protein ACXITR_03585 [Cyanobacterium sp.]